MRAHPWLTAVLAWASACAAPAAPPPAPAATLPRGAELVLPPDWATRAPEPFERWVLEALPDDRATPLAKASLNELQRALDQVDAPAEGADGDLPAVRAAVILGRSRYPGSASPLIRRLERRSLGPTPWSDAGDVIAAAALGRYPDPARYAQRLVPLAAGSRPHPDLEVRVECAATALHAGFPEVIPFLLKVLRIDTPAGRADERDFAVSPDTTWARSRAAEALSAYAGVPVTYQAEGSIAQREAETAKLAARLLAPPGPGADAAPGP